MFALLRRYAPPELVLLVVLVCSVATGGMLPVWAQLAGVEGVHACHCAADHHDCVCAHCGTDPDAKAARLVPTVKGRCGEDEVGFGGQGFVAVVPAPIARVMPPRAARTGSSSPPVLLTRHRARPPLPPPRTA